MEIKNIYNAKVLLFGEYTILHGSHALAMPTGLFSGTWSFDEQLAKEQREILSRFHVYLSDLQFEYVNYQGELFQKDLDLNIAFDSDIPIGFGVGSSGAVTAAIFDRYFQKNNELEISILKDILGKMESFFHGSSSGLDPLICYLHKTILLEKGVPSIIETPNIPQGYDLFLLNTGLPRKTEPFVNHFLEKYHSDNNFRQLIRNELSDLNNLAIRQYLDGDGAALYTTFNKISAFQWQHFQKMIPEKIKAVWNLSLTINMFKLKLCGAGGGGFLLGMTPIWDRLENEGVFGDFACLQLK